MKAFTFLSWLYDVRLDEQGIRFILLRFWTIYLLKPCNIESITEIGMASIGAWNAYNFKNRFFARCFMINIRRGWFARKVLITPKSADEFVAWSRLNSIDLRIG